MKQANPFVRTFQLAIPDNSVEKAPFRFLPGQWVDVHLPDLPKAGGFTITSTPFTALKPESSFIFELAIQDQPRNPAAAYFWRSWEELKNTHIRVRVGGSFVYPPAWAQPRMIERAVFVAGGVGINPLISMIKSICDTGFPESMRPRSIRILYTTRNPLGTEPPYELKDVLFLRRLNEEVLKSAQHKHIVDVELDLFLTGSPGNMGGEQDGSAGLNRVSFERINNGDLEDALGPVEGREKTVAYVCGPPAMTDQFVKILANAKGMVEDRVLCEKWW
jgi:NAD(P)H-flavin reductase